MTKQIAAILALWTLALVAILALAPGAFSKVAGVLAVCMIGSIWVLRRPAGRS